MQGGSEAAMTVSGGGGQPPEKRQQNLLGDDLFSNQQFESSRSTEDTEDMIDSLLIDESVADDSELDSRVNLDGKFGMRAQSKDAKTTERSANRYDRLHLLEALRRAFVRREEFQRHSNEIQTTLAKYFRRKKTDAAAKHESNARDQELRYLKDLDLMEELRATQLHKTNLFEETIRRMKERSSEKMKNVENEREKFTKYKQLIAKNAISRRTGTYLPEKLVENYVTMSEKKDAEVYAIRLEYIRRKNKLRQKEQQLKLKENLGEGLSLIDFEQLKIENQTYNEKIEERNEELLKLRRKITSTVQVLTHLKEKLQWLQRDNQVHGDILANKEASASAKRDVLSRTKRVRDLLRRDNQKLRIQGGLGGSKILLRDFEEKRDQLDEVIKNIEKNKIHHAELCLNIARIRNKIEKSRIKKNDEI